MAAGNEWWRTAVMYEIYPRSFADSNDDGIGDLPGIIEHLDDLEWLGIEGIWLNPTFPSPNADWGYDVSDYYGVHPDLGTMDDLTRLVADAGQRGIRIVLDLVPNHTSIEHAWFADARSSKTAQHRDWYVWADPKPDGSPPNNWTSTFGGSAWTLDPTTDQFYLHNFLIEQPDLNWWNDEVREEFERIYRFWFERDIAGFRIDVAHMIIKDRELRDNPASGAADFVLDRIRQQVPEFNSNRPEVHELYRGWRTLVDSYDPSRMLVGETFVPNVEQLMKYYGNDDELSLSFNIPFLFASFAAEPLSAIVGQTEALLPLGATSVWTGGNHDVSRFPTRWAGGNPAAARCAVLMLLTLRGSAFLYYGDELGMTDTDVPKEQLRDPVSIQFGEFFNRDAARTPMPWTSASGAGFTDEAIEPWLPFGDLDACNVADQRNDPASTLHFTRDLIALRQSLPDLKTGAYLLLEANDTRWWWQRGERIVVALNLGPEPATFEGIAGTVRIATNRDRDGEVLDSTLRLGPWEGAVIERS
jgi:alpha-glucosidase